MKRTLLLLAALCLFANMAEAGPKEELTQLTAKLQTIPWDNALREKIIVLARTARPAVPEEADRRLGRGQAAFETAKDPGDFEKAISEFQLAANAAPWLAAPYYNLGVAQEKAKKYRAAMTSFKLYLLAAPGATDAGDVKQRLYKLEYLAEQPPPDEDLLKRVNGARFTRHTDSILNDSRGLAGYQIEGKTIYYVELIQELGPEDRKFNPQFLNSWRRQKQDNWVYKGNLKWELPREKICIETFAGWSTCQASTFEISQDGRTLSIHGFSYSTRKMVSPTYSRDN